MTVVRLRPVYAWRPDHSGGNVGRILCFETKKTAYSQLTMVGRAVMLVGSSDGALAFGYGFTLAAFEVGGACFTQDRGYGTDLNSFSIATKVLNCRQGSCGSPKRPC